MRCTASRWRSWRLSAIPQVRDPVLLIDSCAHPTCDGQWIGGRAGVNHDELAINLQRSGYTGALAVGLPGVGSYDHREFLAKCASHPNLVPVAALTRSDTLVAAARDLNHIAALGFRIVKVHPRLLGYEQTLEMLPGIFDACIERDLAMALCTYPEYRSSIGPDDARGLMAQAIVDRPSGQFLAMHAGVLDPDPFAVAAAANPGVLLDFSLSLLKYPDEVMDPALRITAFQPRAACLGSDGPEWTYDQVAKTLVAVRRRAGDAAASALGGQNLARWLHELGIHIGCVAESRLGGTGLGHPEVPVVRKWPLDVRHPSITQDAGGLIE